MSERFRVGVTRDLRGDDGAIVRDLSLDLFAAEPRVDWEFLPRRELVLSPHTISGFDALMVWEPGGITAATPAGGDRLVLIARFRMGVEAIGLEACARHGVLVTTSSFAVREVIPAGAMAAAHGCGSCACRSNWRTVAG